MNKDVVVISQNVNKSGAVKTTKNNYLNIGPFTFSEIEIAPDGSCLFTSIFKATRILMRNNHQHRIHQIQTRDHLRCAAAIYLSAMLNNKSQAPEAVEEKERVKLLIHQSIEMHPAYGGFSASDYLKEMADPDNQQWGGVAEIYALEKILKISILIINTDANGNRVQHKSRPVSPLTCSGDSIPESLKDIDFDETIFLTFTGSHYQVLNMLYEDVEEDNDSASANYKSDSDETGEESQSQGPNKGSSRSTASTPISSFTDGERSFEHSPLMTTDDDLFHILQCLTIDSGTLLEPFIIYDRITKLPMLNDPNELIHYDYSTRTLSFRDPDKKYTVCYDSGATLSDNKYILQISTEQLFIKNGTNLASIDANINKLTLGNSCRMIPSRNGAKIVAKNVLVKEEANDAEIILGNIRIETLFWNFSAAKCENKPRIVLRLMQNNNFNIGSLQCYANLLLASNELDSNSKLTIHHKLFLSRTATLTLENVRAVFVHKLKVWGNIFAQSSHITLNKSIANFHGQLTFKEGIDSALNVLHVVDSTLNFDKDVNFICNLISENAKIKGKKEICFDKQTVVCGESLVVHSSKTTWSAETKRSFSTLSLSAASHIDYTQESKLNVRMLDLNARYVSLGGVLNIQGSTNIETTLYCYLKPNTVFRCENVSASSYFLYLNLFGTTMAKHFTVVSLLKLDLGPHIPMIISADITCKIILNQLVQQAKYINVRGYRGYLSDLYNNMPDSESFKRMLCNMHDPRNVATSIQFLKQYGPRINLDYLTIGRIAAEPLKYAHPQAGNSVDLVIKIITFGIMALAMLKFLWQKIWCDKILLHPLALWDSLNERNARQIPNLIIRGLNLYNSYIGIDNATDIIYKQGLDAYLSTPVSGTIWDAFLIASKPFLPSVTNYSAANVGLGCPTGNTYRKTYYFDYTGVDLNISKTVEAQTYRALIDIFLQSSIIAEHVTESHLKLSLPMHLFSSNLKTHTYEQPYGSYQHVANLNFMATGVCRFNHVSSFSKSTIALSENAFFNSGTRLRLFNSNLVCAKKIAVARHALLAGENAMLKSTDFDNYGKMSFGVILKIFTGRFKNHLGGYLDADTLRIEGEDDFQNLGLISAGSYLGAIGYKTFANNKTGEIRGGSAELNVTSYDQYGKTALDDALLVHADTVNNHEDSTTSAKQIFMNGADKLTHAGDLTGSNHISLISANELVVEQGASINDIKGNGSAFLKSPTIYNYGEITQNDSVTIQSNVFYQGWWGKISSNASATIEGDSRLWNLGSIKGGNVVLDGNLVLNVFGWITADMQISSTSLFFLSLAGKISASSVNLESFVSARFFNFFNADTFNDQSLIQFANWNLCVPSSLSGLCNLTWQTGLNLVKKCNPIKALSTVMSIGSSGYAMYNQAGRVKESLGAQYTQFTENYENFRFRNVAASAAGCVNVAINVNSIISDGMSLKGHLGEVPADAKEAFAKVVEIKSSFQKPSSLVEGLGDKAWFVGTTFIETFRPVTYTKSLMHVKFSGLSDIFYSKKIDDSVYVYEVSVPNMFKLPGFIKPYANKVKQYRIVRFFTERTINAYKVHKFGEIEDENTQISATHMYVDRYKAGDETQLNINNLHVNGQADLGAAKGNIDTIFNNGTTDVTVPETNRDNSQDLKIGKISNTKGEVHLENIHQSIDLDNKAGAKIRIDKSALHSNKVANDGEIFIDGQRFSESTPIAENTVRPDVACSADAQVKSTTNPEISRSTIIIDNLSGKGDIGGQPALLAVIDGDIHNVNVKSCLTDLRGKTSGKVVIDNTEFRANEAESTVEQKPAETISETAAAQPKSDNSEASEAKPADILSGSIVDQKPAEDIKRPDATNSNAESLTEVEVKRTSANADVKLDVEIQKGSSVTLLGCQSHINAKIESGGELNLEKGGQNLGGNISNNGLFKTAVPTFLDKFESTASSTNEGNQSYLKVDEIIMAGKWKTHNFAINAKSLIHDGINMDYTGYHAIDTEHYEEKGNSNLANAVADGAYFQFESKDNVPHFTHFAKHVHIKCDVLPATEALDLALGRGAFQNFAVASNGSITVKTESGETIFYAGPRSDGVPMRIITNGKVLLPADQYSRAPNKTFDTYEQAHEFVTLEYAEFNLPPPPKKKWHEKIKREYKKAERKGLQVVSTVAGAISAYCAKGVAFMPDPATKAILFIGGVAASGISYGAERVRNGIDKRAINKLQNKQLADAQTMFNRQNVLDVQLEKQVLAEQQVVENLSAMENVFNGKTSAQDIENQRQVNQDNRQSTRSKLDDYLRQQVQNRERVLSEIRTNAQINREMVDKLSKTGFSAGVGANIGPNGYSFGPALGYKNPTTGKQEYAILPMVDRAFKGAPSCPTDNAYRSSNQSAANNNSSEQVNNSERDAEFTEKGSLPSFKEQTGSAPLGNQNKASQYSQNNPTVDMQQANDKGSEPFNQQQPTNSNWGRQGILEQYIIPTEHQSDFRSYRPSAPYEPAHHVADLNKIMQGGLPQPEHSSAFTQQRNASRDQIHKDRTNSKFTQRKTRHGAPNSRRLNVSKDADRMPRSLQKDLNEDVLRNVPGIESDSLEKWHNNYGVKLTVANALWLYATNQLLPNDRKYLKETIGSGLVQGISQAEERAFGPIRRAKNAFVSVYDKDARIRNHIAKLHGIKPNLTGISTAAPAFARAVVSLVPETPEETALTVAPVPMLFAVKKAFRYGHMAYHMAKNGVGKGRAAFKVNEALKSGVVKEMVWLKGANPGAPIVLYAQPKLLINSGKLTKGQLVDYLQNIDKVPMKQLANDLEKVGFRLLERRPDKQIYKFSHIKNELREAANVKANLESSKVMVEIHFDAKSGSHMHITDAKGNVYDKHLNNLTDMIAKKFPNKNMDAIIKKSERLPEAHIKIKEFVELNMRLYHE